MSAFKHAFAWAAMFGRMAKRLVGRRDMSVCVFEAADGTWGVALCENNKMVRGSLAVGRAEAYAQFRVWAEEIR